MCNVQTQNDWHNMLDELQQYKTDLQKQGMALYAVSDDASRLLRLPSDRTDYTVCLIEAQTDEYIDVLEMPSGAAARVTRDNAREISEDEIRIEQGKRREQEAAYSRAHNHARSAWHDLQTDNLNDSLTGKTVYDKPAGEKVTVADIENVRQHNQPIPFIRFDNTPDYIYLITGMSRRYADCVTALKFRRGEMVPMERVNLALSRKGVSEAPWGDDVHMQTQYFYVQNNSETMLALKFYHRSLFYERGKFATLELYQGMEKTPAVYNSSADQWHIEFSRVRFRRSQISVSIPVYHNRGFTEEMIDVVTGIRETADEWDNSGQPLQ